jgi:primosomal replication protein N
MRYTPAGLPALNLQLEHDSELIESGVNRKVKVTIRAIAFGTLAERLAKQAIGSVWRFIGFLASARQGKSVVFHIQEFLQD